VAHGRAIAPFRLTLPEQIVSMEDEDLRAENFKVEEIEEVGMFLSCPSCKKNISIPSITEGFFKWLEKVKKEDPKRYAEAIAFLL